MKNAPTLADTMIGHFLKPHSPKGFNGQWIVNNILHANKFVLDKDMSAFLADLSYATLSDNVGIDQRLKLSEVRNNRRSVILDSLRRQAHLPHKVTWIEYDFMAKARRSAEAYGSVIDLTPGQSPDRCGWLCLQHPQLETAFMAIECASHTWRPRRDSKRLERIDDPTPSWVAYTWRTDDGPPPWSDADIAQYFGVMGRVSFTDGRPDEWMPPEAAVTGIFEYRSECVKVVRAPHVSLELVNLAWKHDKMFNPLKELAGDLRYLWSFLATLNDLPVSLSDVRASKGFVARGRYRKFVDHKIIHLHIPEKRYKRVAAQAIAISRRRAHPVRSHFRIDRHRPPSPLCDHEWGPADEHRHLTCNICHGRKLYIHEHMRGDASLGIVTHDYVVEHEPI